MGTPLNDPRFEPESILPEDDDVSVPDELLALDESLDIDDDDDPLADDSDADVVLDVGAQHYPIGRSWAFDFGRSRFVAHGTGALETRGEATLRGWIEKCLYTDRGAHLIHPPDYGVEGLNDVIGEPLAFSTGADLERRIREALLFHPRITDVVGFQRRIDEVEEAITVRFTVVTDDEELVEIDDLMLRSA